MKRKTISHSEAKEIWHEYKMEVSEWYLEQHPLYIIRLEAWDKNGSNTDYHSESLGNHSEEEALIRARQLWKQMYVGQKKEIKLYSSKGVILKHRNYGKGSTLTKAM